MTDMEMKTEARITSARDVDAFSRSAIDASDRIQVLPERLANIGERRLLVTDDHGTWVYDVLEETPDGTLVCRFLSWSAS